MTCSMSASIKIDFPAAHNDFHFVVKSWDGGVWVETFRTRKGREATAILLKTIADNAKAMREGQ